MILQPFDATHQYRGVEAALRDRADRGAHLLRPRLATLGVHGEKLREHIYVCTITNIHYADYIFPFQLLYAAMNLTTNEMFNYKRYNYLKNGRTGKYHNPYSRGIFYNLAEFFLCVEPLEGEPIPDNSEAADDNELI